jgi:hypothetical protein
MNVPFAGGGGDGSIKRDEFGTGHGEGEQVLVVAGIRKGVQFLKFIIKL